MRFPEILLFWSLLLFTPLVFCCPDLFQSIGNDSSVARFHASGIAVSDEYALDTPILVFAGGLTAGVAGVASGVVDMFRINEGLWMTETMVVPRYWMAAGAVSSCVLFAGGFNGSYVFPLVEMFDIRANSWTMFERGLSVARYQLASASFPQQVLFAGGINVVAYNTVDVYNSTSRKFTTYSPGLSRNSFLLSGVVGGGLGFFAGGALNVGGNVTGIVDIYNPLTNSWSVSQLSIPRCMMGSTSAGDFVLFAGGTNYVLDFNRVDIYNFVSSIWSSVSFSASRRQPAAMTVGCKAVFAGGYTGSSSIPSSAIDIFDSSSRLWSTFVLSSPRSFLASASLKSVGMAFGGSIASSSSKSINYFRTNTCSPGYYPSPDGCTACPAGYFGGNSLVCSSCGIGYYGDKTAATTCTICPIGSYNNLQFQTVCFKCAVGYFGSEIGLTIPTCTGSCTPYVGSYCDYGVTAAYGILVNPGSFKPTDTNQVAYINDRYLPFSSLNIPCPANKYSIYAGSADCAPYNDVPSLKASKVSALSAKRMGLAAASSSNIAMFAGGFNDTQPTNVVDILNLQTTLWTTSTLSISRWMLSANSVGKYMLFAGGYLKFGNATGVVDIYDVSTKSFRALQLRVPRGQLASASVLDVVFFAGGSATYLPASTQNAVNVFDTVDIFNATLQNFVSSNQILSVKRFALAGASCSTPLPSSYGSLSVVAFAGGNSGIYGSGNTGAYSNVVDIFTFGMGWTTSSLYVGRAELVGINVGTILIFAGGYNGTACGVVDFYNSYTKAWTTMSLYVPRYRMSASSVGSKAVFLGGLDENGSPVDSAEIYDFMSLDKRIIPAQFIAVSDLASVTVGYTIVAAGGILNASALSSGLDTAVYLSFCTTGSSLLGGNCVCGPGYYTFQTNPLICLLVSQGQYSSGYGANSSLGDGICYAVPGYFCGEGETNSTGRICPKGTYSEGNFFSCILCPAGKFGSEPGLTGPECSGPCFAAENSGSKCLAGATAATGIPSNCSAGTYSDTDFYSCRGCSPGRFSPYGGLSACYICDAGTSSLASKSTCSDCPQGWYSPAESFNCSVCTAGKYSTSRSGSCILCENGEWSTHGSYRCQACGSGTFSVQGDSVCTACTAGSYSETSGKSTCSPCEAGKFSLTSASYCPACNPGTYNSITGATFCNSCISPYYSGSGMTECSRCLPGFIAIGGNNITGPVGCKSCPAGTFSSADGVECTVCALGTYQSSTSMSSCQECPDNFFPNFNRTGCIDSFKFSTSLSSVIYVLGVVTILSVLGMVLFVYRHRQDPVLHASSGVMLFAILIGMILCCIAAIIFSTTQTAESCEARDWFAVFGFNLIFGSIFAKSWRLYKIFNPTGLQVIHVPDIILLWRLIPLYAYDFLLLCIQTGTSPYWITSDLIHQCQRDNGALFFSLIWTPKLLMMLYCAYCCWHIRNIDINYNEAKHIAATIWHFLVVASVMIIIISSLRHVVRDVDLYFAGSFVSIFIVMVTFFILFYPKIIAVLYPAEPELYVTPKTPFSTSAFAAGSYRTTPTPGGTTKSTKSSSSDFGPDTDDSQLEEALESAEKQFAEKSAKLKLIKMEVAAALKEVHLIREELAFREASGSSASSDISNVSAEKSVTTTGEQSQREFENPLSTIGSSRGGAIQLPEIRLGTKTGHSEPSISLPIQN